MRYSKLCSPHAVLIADQSSLEASASETPSRKLSTRFFDPTGALFAGVTFSFFDGKLPLRELPKSKPPASAAINGPRRGLIPLANARGSEALILSRDEEGAAVKSYAGHHTRPWIAR
jgi:hypothetical protein